MTSQRKIEFTDLDDILSLPTHTIGFISLARGGKHFKLKIQSLPDIEQEQINKVCKEPMPPLVEEMERDEKGKVVYDQQGNIIKSKKRDVQDIKYLVDYTEYIKKSIEAIAASCLIIKWDPDQAKSNNATLEQKMAILRSKFSSEEIREIANRGKELSRTSMVDLNEEVKD